MNEGSEPEVPATTQLRRELHGVIRRYGRESDALWIKSARQPKWLGDVVLIFDVGWAKEQQSISCQCEVVNVE